VPAALPIDLPDAAPLCMSWLTEYLRNVVSEMRKVSWPSRDELISSTAITILATAIIATLVYFTDQVLSTVLDFIYTSL
jgi:preprotein translocase subunit SecE